MKHYVLRVLSRDYVPSLSSHLQPFAVWVGIFPPAQPCGLLGTRPPIVRGVSDVRLPESGCQPTETNGMLFQPPPRTRRLVRFFTCWLGVWEATSGPDPGWPGINSPRSVELQHGTLEPPSIMHIFIVGFRADGGLNINTSQ